MASQTLIAGAGANVDPGDGSTRTWATPGAVTADDGGAASASGLNSTTPSRNSQRLEATSFGFSVPTGATIDGIVVEIERHRTAADAVRDRVVRLLKAGAVTGDDKATATSWATSPTIDSYGASSDLWGTTWTPAEVNASGFGLGLQAGNDLAGNATAQVDFIRITVHYTEAAGGVSLTPATETDTAQPLSIASQTFKTLGSAFEFDTPQQLSLLNRTLGPAVESDVAQSLSVSQAGSVTLASALETDTAQALVFVKPIRKTLVAVLETDAAIALGLVGAADPATAIRLRYRDAGAYLVYREV